MSEISFSNTQQCSCRIFTNTRSRTQMRSKSLLNAIFLGLIGGLIATIVMDLACAGFFKITGTPVDLIYSFIGEAARNFLLMTGINFPWVIQLGVFVHFSLGLVLGGILGALISQISAFRGISIRKGILFGIIYIEIASQPILVTAPLFKEMTASGILQWYALSTVMHAIYGIILGGFLSYKKKVRLHLSV
jgi:hypothetical protein